MASKVHTVLKASASLDFGSVAAGSEASLTVTVEGARQGDAVLVTPPSTLNTGLVVSKAYVSADDTVTVVVYNPTAAAIDPAAATFVVVVLV